MTKKSKPSATGGTSTAGAATGAPESVAATIARLRGRPNTRIVCGEDSTFGIPLVYAYSDVETRICLVKTLFANPNRSEWRYTSLEVFGESADELGRGKIGLIWFSNETPLLATLPRCLRAIFFVTHDIMVYTGAFDGTEELSANTIERETRRVLRELYGFDIPSESRVGKLEEWLKPREPREPREPRKARH